MNKLKTPGLLLAIGLTLTTPVFAERDVDAPVTIVPQLGYEVKLTGVSEAVVYLEFAGQKSPAPDWRNFVESQCELYRKVGTTTATPTFADGWDKPLKNRSVTILAKHMRYHFYEFRTYDNGSDDPKEKTEFCGGQYRVRVHTSVAISKVRPERTVNATYEFETKKGLISNLRTAAMVDFRTRFGPADSRFILKPGQGTGVGQVLGLPCVVVPSLLDTKDQTSESCYASADNEKVPKIMEGRALKGISTWWVQGKKISESREATRLIPSGLIDSGVFDGPAGMVMREHTDPGLKAAK